MGRRTIGVAIVAMLASPTADAAHRGSVEDQIACTPDVYRLCSNFIPNEDQIVACLTRNKPALSEGCAKVFAQPNPGSDDNDN